MRSLAKSNQHFRKAVRKLPLGVSSNFRYWGEDKTVYVRRGKGARVWDIDGNEYIDYRLAYGPVILGYGDPRVDEAATAGMDVGGVFALSTELEYEVACRINKMVPAAELVRFSNSGTEAVEAALKIARLHTGRSGFVAMERGFHGRTMGALSVTAEKRFREPFAPLIDGVQRVPYDDVDALRMALNDSVAMLAAPALAVAPPPSSWPRATGCDASVTPDTGTGLRRPAASSRRRRIGSRSARRRRCS